MKEKYLTLQQNTCAARIFLNTFGLTLETINEVTEFSKIKIFDRAMNEVGNLYFDNGKVIMSANYNNSVLDASFDRTEMLKLIDLECESAPFAVFGEWSSKITFQLQKADNITLSGEFLVASSTDTEFGISCLCHPLINCQTPENENIILKILRDGSVFSLELVSVGSYELIDVRPWDWLNGFLIHDIKKGKYDKENYAYPYRRYVGIFNGAEIGEDKDKLHVFLNEEKYKETLNLRSDFISKIGDDNSEEGLLQKGRLMQDLDPTMYKKIEELRNILLIGDVSLLDNLIGVCYDSYTDEELSTLLGVKRQPMNYQDGASSLVNSYFGIEKNNCFFPLEEQKRLLKK